MQASDYPRFQAVMTGMAELYQRELSGPLLDVYWLALADWELHEFEAAARQLMKTEEFMPKPTAFNSLRKAGRMTAGEAWAYVLKFARTEFNFWDSGRPTIKPSAIFPESNLINRAVAAIGGYSAIAGSNTDKTQFLEKRFCEHYESLQDADEVREAVPEIAFDRQGLLGPMSMSNLLGRLNGAESE